MKLRNYSEQHCTHTSESANIEKSTQELAIWAPGRFTYVIYLVWPCMLNNDILPSPLTLNCQTRKFRPTRIPVTSAEHRFPPPSSVTAPNQAKSNTGKRFTQTDYNCLCHSVFLHYRYVNRLRFNVAWRSCWNFGAYCTVPKPTL